MQPTLAAARARIAAVRPKDYAATRNHLDGAVSGLSPYLTHGFVTLTEVLSGVAARHPLHVQHKFVYELGWRAFFRHVWAHRGDGILRSLHDGMLPDEAYARELPSDLRQARTGVPAIDAAVRTLYATGTLHNHARMWLASYAVHLRKLHWRSAADWLCAHLLDGDLASNHLSWQWVAGTGSHKPYLFNAGNVARFAPAAWHSPGTVIDTAYEMLDAIARSPQAVPSAPQGEGVTEPACLAEPPAALGCTAPDADAVRGREVWLVHPWNLGALPADLDPDARVIGLFVADFHRAWPWSERRWQFVGTRMAELAPQRWHGDARSIGQALAAAKRVRSLDEPHLAPWLSRWADCAPAPLLFPDVAYRFNSFSPWWAHVTRGLHSIDDLLAGRPIQPEVFP
ncbi:FAD-binding domain-containing protein [Variovorax sp. YR752]|uniref:FAD-binding domain-containing protein n=1 Tax=Variovorax sp. YR752 TaxID=1884383 RepID=UPI003137CCFD